MLLLHDLSRPPPLLAAGPKTPPPAQPPPQDSRTIAPNRSRARPASCRYPVSSPVGRRTNKKYSILGLQLGTPREGSRSDIAREHLKCCGPQLDRADRPQLSHCYSSELAEDGTEARGTEAPGVASNSEGIMPFPLDRNGARALPTNSGTLQMALRMSAALLCFMCVTVLSSAEKKCCVIKGTSELVE